MFNIFIIELKKILFQKKTYIIWIVFILMLFLNRNVNMIDRERKISDELDRPNNVENVNRSLQRIKDNLADKNISKEEKLKYEKYLKNKENQLANYNIILDKNADDMSKIKAKIDVIKSELFEISEGKLFTPIPVVDYNKELRFLQYLYDNKIPECTVSQNSFKYVFNFFAGLFPALFLLLVVLLSSDIVTKEMEESTIKLLLVQPVSRLKVITGKYLALITSIVMIILTSFFSAFVIIGITKGVGNPKYPFIINMKYSFNKDLSKYVYINGSGKYISSLALLVRVILFFLLISITVASISFMISVLSNSSTVAMSIGIILNVGLMYIVASTNLLKNLKQYIYITYYNSYDVFSGKIIQTLSNTNISPLLGIIQMIVILILTYAVSCVVFLNKDI